MMTLSQRNKNIKIWRKSLKGYMKLMNFVGLTYNHKTDEFIYMGTIYTNIQDLIDYLNLNNLNLTHEIRHKNPTDIFIRKANHNIFNELVTHNRHIRCF